MMYEIVLTGGKTLTVTEDQKKKLESYMVEKDGGMVTCLLGNNTIKVSMVKGIFEVKDQSFVPMNKKIEQQHQSWDEMCAKMAVWGIKEKTENEVNARILPMFKKKTISDELMPVLYQTIEAFFTSHPKYPRCPSKIWWPMVKDFTDTQAPLFMEYVIRNDNAIEEYVKFHR